jgi:hypothetical protein
MQSRRAIGIAAAALAALIAPAAASAAAKPVVTTGGASSVGQTTVTLNGRVNPREADTTYFFQIGPTSLYGTNTAPAPAGNGNRAIRVSVPVTGLAPATTYHFRIVAQNRRGLVKGKDRTFRTQRQPLGVTLAATPDPIRAGRSTTLAGQLTGTGSAGRQVVLQANPFPYTQGFQNVTNAQVTDANGGFAFPLLSVPVNTQYRVLMPQRPEVTSPVVVLETAVGVTTRVRNRRGDRRRRLRFSGRIFPAAPGSQVFIQKFRRNRWVNIARTFARDSGPSFSRYSRRVRQRRGGRYRVWANVQGAYIGNVGRTVRVRRVRR